MGACEVKVEKTRGGWDRLVLSDSRTHARAEIHPARGALVSSFGVGGQELLYLDEETLFDTAKNVRGGVPLLFPIAGKLKDAQYELRGRRYQMEQHGFARKLPWQIMGTRSGEAAVVRCGLHANAQTLAQFPFPFEATYQVSLSQRTLEVIFTVKNTGSEQLPLHFGLHPYFLVRDAFKDGAKVSTDAKTAFDNRTATTGAFAGFDFRADELDLHLLDQRARRARLDRPPLSPVELGWDDAFGTMVVWTVKGKDFICVEPWTEPAGALARRDVSLQILPGQQRSLVFWIRAGM